MYKIFRGAWVTACLLLISSCEKLTDLNRNPNAINADDVNTSYVLSSLLVQTATLYTDEFVYRSNYGISQAMQYLQKDYVDYDVNNFLWSPVDYSYTPLKTADYILERAEQMEDSAAKSYYMGVSLILKSFWFGFYTSIWGDIPYSEAMQAEQGLYTPKYDRQQDVFIGILQDLGRANDLLTGAGILPEAAQADLVYQGNTLQWQKFANSLRLRFYLRLAEKADEMGAQGIDLQAKFSEIVGNPEAYPIMSDVSDNASISYIGTNANNSWSGGALSYGGNRSQFYRRKPASTIIRTLTDLADPRLVAWFRPVDVQILVRPDETSESYIMEDGRIKRILPTMREDVDTSLFVGLLPALKEPDDYNLNNSADYQMIRSLDAGIYTDAAANPHVSYLSDAYSSNASPIVKSVWMSSAEVSLLLAEARLKGWISAGSVADYYENGIRNGLTQYRIESETSLVYHPTTHQLVPFDLESYMNKRKAAFMAAVAVGEEMNLIMREKWVALWMTPEYWFDWRRTGLPALNEHLQSASNGDRIPLRFSYGENEYSLNEVHVRDGVSQLSPAEDNIWSTMWLLQ